MIQWNDALVGLMDLSEVLFRGSARKRNLDAARAASTRAVQVVRGVLCSRLEAWILLFLNCFFVHWKEPTKSSQMSLG